MQALTEIDIERHALFLDFDGTLVEFAQDPAAVTITPRSVHDLAGLQTSLSGALAVISGRRIADLDRFLHPLSFAAAGVHGLELRRTPGGPVEFLAKSESLDPARAFLAASIADDAELRLEDKGTALVLHFRGAPHRERDAYRLMEQAVAGADRFKLMAGKAIVEIHPAGMDKGAAIATLMQNPPFAGRVPIYFGDDTTDEYAFAALQQWGGIGVKVGPGTTVAQHRIDNVAAVRGWLQSANAASGALA